MKAGFKVKRIYAIFSVDGVDGDTVNRYEARQPSDAPSVKNARIDKNGRTVKVLKSSKWNRTLTSLFAKETEVIASNFTDGRFGQSPDWLKCFRTRIDTVLRQEIDAQLQSGETHEERVWRLAKKHNADNNRKKETSMRQLVGHLKLIWSKLLIRCIGSRSVGHGQILRLS